MKLLVFTQSVDKNDPILGFFHNWLIAFSSKFEEVKVIALRTGEISLPDNVSVLALRKQKSQNKIFTLVKLIVLIWNNRRTGDAIFVHMNKEYVLAGWLIWKLSHRPLYFWYNHSFSDWLAFLAIRLSKKVFYTSEHSAAAKYVNSVAMPVGVDTEMFKNSISINDRGRTLLSLGRIDPVKKIDILSRTILLLDEKSELDFQTIIAGSPSWGNEKYASLIREVLKPLMDKGRVFFKGGLYHEKTPELFNQNKIFINLTPPGSFDKTILEAMACGCLIVAANNSVWKVIGDNGKILSINPEEVGQKIKISLSLSGETAEHQSVKNRDFVLKHHSLDLLASALKKEISE